MKVVHLVPAMEQGGVESVVLNLSRALVEHGDECVVASRGGRLVQRLERMGARHVAMDLKSKNPLTYFSRALRLRKLLAAEKPDLVCAHSRVPAWLFVFANRKLHLKWISYAHGANSVSAYSAVMTKGDLTVVPSRFLADFLKANYRIEEARLRIVPNAVDLERFNPDHLDCEFMEQKRREWKLNSKTQMSIGRITPVKGFDEIIRRLRSNERLVIVGGADNDKTDYLEYLKSIAGDNVVFASQQEKIPECLALADEVVSGNTTKPESFGLSVAEAYAMNRPVRVLRRFGGVAEIMDAVEGELKKGAANYREAVQKLYGFDIISAKTISVYKELTK